ncbi:phasin family protein [Paraburkholderia hospita]|jgi:hypothetical protein|uniref:phasin family protein n=1 Tax=Paraburkholderia hospita TaxID=169430 RepID=UPI003ECEAA6F
MLEGEEKLVRLNLDMTKTSFSVWYQQVQDGLARKDGQDLTRLAKHAGLPAVENVLTYERQVQWFVENVSQNIPSAPSLQSHF